MAGTVGSAATALWQKLVEMLGFEGVFRPPIIEKAVCGGSVVGTLKALLPTYLFIGVSGVFFLVFLYLLGILIGNKRLQSYSKAELTEFFFFIIFVIVVIPVLLEVNCLPLPLFGGTESVYSIGYRLWLEMTATLKLSFYFLQIMAFIAGGVFTPNIHTIYFTSPMAFQGIWSLIKAVMNTTMISIATSEIVSASMLYLYDIMTYGFIEVLLPLGVILRAFPPFRKIGGTLVGLSVGMALFLPLLSALFYEFFSGQMIVRYNLQTNKPELSSPAYRDVLKNLNKISSIKIKNLAKDITNKVGKNAQNLASDQAGQPVKKEDVTPPKQPSLVPTAYGLSPWWLLGPLGSAGISMMGSYISVLLPGRTSAAAGGLFTTVGALSILMAMTVFSIQFLPIVLELAFTVTVITAILNTALKVFTAFFGEPLDISNLTRLV